MRELTRVVGNDCAVEIDTNSYSVPWRLIGERVAVTVAAGEVRIRHGVREVAVHKQSSRVAVCGSSIAPTSTVSPVAMALSAGRRSRHRRCRRRLHRPRCCGRWPNTKPRSEGASDGARKESDRSADRSARRHAGDDCKLSGIRDQLDSLLDEAARANLSARETLILLCEREIARKDHRRIEMALKLAHFPAVKELAGFDFEAQPSIDPKQIRDLAASRWIANGENVLLLGPPGVGKTHLSIALGREAILAGYSVQFTTATALVAGLAKAHGERRLDEKLLALSKPKLLIVDELGYLPLEPDAAHLFFQLVSRRYEDRRHADHVQPQRRRMGHGVRRSGRRDGDPRPAPAPQPRADHPRR